MVKEQFLHRFGLDKKEVEIYLSLIRSNGISIAQLARDLSLPRSTLQFKCQRLEEKGLIRSLITKKTHQYFAEPPEKLMYLLDQQTNRLGKMREELPEVISELKKIIAPDSILPKIKFFQGVNGIIEMFNDVLADQTSLYGMTKNEGDLNEEVLLYLEKEYIPKRKLLRNPAWIIFNDNPTTRNYQTYDHEVNRISLLIPQHKYPFSACCHIYGQKVAFYSYNKNDLSGVIIENPYIRETQFSLFKLAWNYARLLPINAAYVRVDL